MRAEPNPTSRLGAHVLEEGGVAFTVWAPRQERLAIELSSRRARVALSRDDRGFFTGVSTDARPGDDYWLVLADGRRVPDPASRRQPDGVHGPSRVVDPAAFAWTSPPSSPPPLRDAVLYELHVGAFTREGTFDAAIPRLPALAALGVTTIELMPVASFPGARNWGYDGVGLFAPQETYGGPEGLRRLVDAAHAVGLSVLLDVVYNHFGPEGCYWEALAPYTTGRHTTPWGSAINFDGRGSDGVRRFVTENVRMWIRDFRVDGLRLDAVQTMYDETARHVLLDISEAARDEAARDGRRVHVIAESNQNDPRVTAPEPRGGLGLDAQWTDDLHHAIHAAHLGARSGTFVDFGAPTHVDKALARGFVIDGVYSAYRERRHGAASETLDPAALVAFLDNHDQIANGRGGARVTDLASEGLERALLALLLLGPNVPMLFMGQERAARTPFHYFVDHGDEALRRAVREGRAREHAAYGLPMPDPCSPATFEACVLTDEDPTGRGARTLSLVRDLLALRRASGGAGAVEVERRGALLSLTRPRGPTPIVLLANLGGDAAPLPRSLLEAERLLQTSPTTADEDLPPETALVLRA